MDRVHMQPCSIGTASALAYLAGIASGALLLYLVLPAPGSEIREGLEDLGWRVRRKAGHLAREAGEALQEAEERISGS